MAQGIDNLAQTAANLAGMAQVTFELIFWIVGIVIIAVIAWFLWYVLSFNITVLVKEKVSRAYQYEQGAYYGEPNISEDIDSLKNSMEQATKFNIIPTVNKIFKGKLTMKKGSRILHLQFGPKIKLPDNLYHSMTTKGKKFIEMLKVSKNIYLPIVLESDTGIEKYVDDDSYVEWLAEDIENDYKKFQFKSFWDKYGSFLMTAGMMVIVLMIIVVTFKYSNEHVESSKIVAEAFVNAAQQMSQQCVSG